MSRSTRTENLSTGLQFRASGVISRIVLSTSIEESLAQWWPLTFWRTPESLPIDWPVDDPAPPLAESSYPIWLEGTYRGGAARAPSSIPIVSQGKEVAQLRVVAWWFYDPEAKPDDTRGGSAPQVKRPALPWTSPAVPDVKPAPSSPAIVPPSPPAVVASSIGEGIAILGGLALTLGAIVAATMYARSR